MTDPLKIIRVFPRRTKATPDDPLSVVGRGPDFFDQADEVHISVTFTWDIPEAERLAKEWERVAPVKIGGPAFGSRGDDFEPGRYLRAGYVITSRGCPNRCWFCYVWKREGATVRELPIRDGWIIQDDNLLACSDEHIRAVFGMLEKQRERPQFTGGLEAARIKPWHAMEMRRLKTKRVYFAYDTPADLEPLRYAGHVMLGAGFTRASHVLACYVLCGYPKDNFSAAERRMREALDAGFVPMAMLYRDDKGEREPEWMRWARKWSRPAIIFGKQ